MLVLSQATATADHQRHDTFNDKSIVRICLVTKSLQVCLPLPKKTEKPKSENMDLNFPPNKRCKPGMVVKDTPPDKKSLFFKLEEIF